MKVELVEKAFFLPFGRRPRSESPRDAAYALRRALLMGV
jgi:hypothetical protein